MSTRFLTTVTLAAVFALVACSGPNDGSAATRDDATGGGAEPRASLTIADGTVFPLHIDLCDVAANTEKSEGYIFFLGSQQDDADELFFRISLSPRPDGGIATLDGVLQTDYVDGSAQANYAFGAEGSTFTVEGTSISGDITFTFTRTRGEKDIFGPSTTGTFMADCS